MAAAAAAATAPSAKTGATTACAALPQSWKDLFHPRSTFTLTQQTVSCSEFSRCPVLEQQQQQSTTGGSGHAAAAAAAGARGAAAHRESIEGAGGRVTAAASLARLGAPLQPSGDTGSRRSAAAVKCEPAAACLAAVAAAVANKMSALLRTLSRRCMDPLADVAETSVAPAAAGAAAAASAMCAATPLATSAEAATGQQAVWREVAAPAMSKERRCFAVPCRHQQQQQALQQLGSTTDLFTTKERLAHLLKGLRDSSIWRCEGVRVSRGTGDSGHSVGRKMILFPLLLLLVVQLSSPEARCSSSCTSLAQAGPLLLLPAAALPLLRKNYGRSSSASSLAAPPVYVASLGLPGPAAAAPPLVQSCGLSPRPSRPSSHNSSAERRSSNSNSSSTEERRGSSTSLAFVSSVRASRLVVGGAGWTAQHDQQQHQQAASAAPLGSRSRRKSKRQGVTSLQRPLLPSLGAASASMASFGSSSDSGMHSGSGTANGAQKEQREGAKDVQSNYLVVPSASAVGAAVPRVVSRSAAAAAPQGSSNGRLVGSVKEVTMPALSSTMKEGRIVSWTKQIGDRVQVGDVLMVVESDKADMDVEAFDAGFMAYHAVPEGISAPVGSTVALIAEQLEDLPLIEQHGVGLLSEDQATAAGDGAPAADEQPAAAPESAEGASEKAQISELILPALGPSARDGHIAVWKKKEGETVKQGEVLFVVESDKADMDVEAPHDGVLARISVDPGVKVPVGTSVGLLARDATGAAAVAASPQQARVSGAPRLPEGTREVFLQVASPAALVSARVVKWVRQVGDFVKTGEKLVVVEDSSGQTLEIASADEGYLAATRVQEQHQAAAGETLALLVATPSDVAVVQRLLQQSVPAARAQGGAEGGAVEYSSFPHKREAAASLATWTFPSVDQDVNAQLPPGLTREDLEGEFLRRVQQRLPPETAAKLRGPEGAELIKRLSLRVPPPHTLRDTTGPSSAAATAPGGADRDSLQDIKHAAVRQGEGASSARAQTGKKGDVQQQTSSFASYDPMGNPLATTHAASLAAKHQLNLEEVRGTGTHARVTLVDVQRHLGLPAEETEVVIRGSGGSSTGRESISGSRGSSGAAAFSRTPLPLGFEKMDSMQKAVARNMEATLGVPVFKMSRAIYVDKLEALLQELKQIVADSHKQAAAKGEQQQPPVTMTVLLAKAVALTIAKHPLLNASYDEQNGGQIKHPGSADLAIAVSLEGGGLVTPVLRDAEKKSVFTLAKEWNTLTEKAKQRRLTPADSAGGTFYISNMGMFGVQQFDAVLPRGVGTIMAVGATETVHQQQHGKTAAAAAAGAGAALTGKSRRMTVTLTCDHRHIYGTHAALFLKDLAALLETRPSELLVQ